MLLTKKSLRSFSALKPFLSKKSFVSSNLIFSSIEIISKLNFVFLNLSSLRILDKLKLNSTKTIVKNKSIILIDDSLVRGTTCLKIVKMLFESGAKEVHVRIACPEIKYPDFYGVDMPTKEELLAHSRNNGEMCEYIKASSLKFLSLDGLYLALVGEKRNIIYPQFSDHYFTGDYPIKPSDKLKGLKVKQLSLLSGKSNS